VSTARQQRRLHFSSYIDAVGGSMVNTNTAPATASFNTADAQQVLQALHNLRSRTTR